MSDGALNQIIRYGTQAQRLAFEPDPATGSQVLYIWYETDNSPDTYVWDGSISPPDWVQINASSGAAIELIEEQTPSGTGTITFSSLGAFTHLRLIWQARSTDTSLSVNMSLRFNADTGSNYDQERLQGASTTASATENIAAAQNLIGTVTAATGSGSNQASSGEIVIYDYRGTTFQKNATAHTVCKRADSTNNILTQHFAVSWRNTAAITSVTAFLSAGNFVAGSKFTLYGMR